MNGLANAILTLLLSWLRIIINRVWALLNSDIGADFFTFLSKSWPVLLLVLAVAGFLLDKIIYLIRWRPFSVRRRQREWQEAQEEPQAYDWPPQQDLHSAYRRPAPAQQPVYGVPAEPVYETAAPITAQTAVYAPAAADHSAYRPPMEDIDPVFDEQTDWADLPDFRGTPATQPVVSHPVSNQYIQDAKAGFARPVPPQQLYAYAPPHPQEQAAEAQPVHPGLDADLFRRNLGLANSGYPADNNDAPVAASFTPFTQKADTEQTSRKSRNPFLNLMRLVGEEAAKPSIHDLHTTVDVRDAFRAPVYPQPLYRNEDDPE